MEDTYAYFPTIFNFTAETDPEGTIDPADNQVFLTQADWDLLIEKAQLATFKANEVILARGDEGRAIHIVKSGTVRIEVDPGAVRARYGAGAVFGEMSFLDGQGASAAVVADGPVEVAVVAAAYVNALLISVPGFATRFYQTLAVTLARRLRRQATRR